MIDRRCGTCDKWEKPVSSQPTRGPLTPIGKCPKRRLDTGAHDGAFCMWWERRKPIQPCLPFEDE